MDIRAIDGDFGAEVTGVDLSKGISKELAATLVNTLHEYGIMAIRDQDLSPEEQCAFTESFGPLDIHHLAEATFPEFPQLRVLTNVKKDGKLIGQFRGGHYWHTDITYTDNPALVTVLHGKECPPEGGNTLFANMRGAYDNLPDDLRELVNGKVAVHDRAFRYSELYPERPPLTDEQISHVPPVEQPMILQHPATGRKSVYLNKSMIRTIGDLDEAASEALLEKLEAHCTQDRFVYSHKWRPGDLVVWDNLSTMHRATPYDFQKHRRVMHRTQVCGPHESVRAA